MLHDGRKMTRVPSMGYRKADPKRDFDAHGSQVMANYVVFVKIADCEVTELQDGRLSYEAKQAPQSVKLSYGGTNYGYAETRHTNKSRHTKTLKDAMGEPFLVKPGGCYRQVCKYLAANGSVYRAKWFMPR
ncbi:hypothetical protein [Thalassospira xiamenensis]|uniref:Uncharacterized protein n=1 Tax=Thalassospira xiamenensis TaxID=220697 RepID=A0A285THY9_9PROT|nr:hypothetical protein [Thalassospira xiamenensis]SOC21358.1 hypothetical protein SAMN05428964_103384 [Thalassospira xiamenensis]